MLASKAHEERRDVLLLLRARQEGFLGVRLFCTGGSNLLFDTLFNSSIDFVHKVLDRDARGSGGPQRRVFVRVVAQLSLELSLCRVACSISSRSGPNLQVRLDDEIVEHIFARKLVRDAVFLMRLSQRRPFGGGSAPGATSTSFGGPAHGSGGFRHSGFFIVRLNFD